MDRKLLAKRIAAFGYTILLAPLGFLAYFILGLSEYGFFYRYFIPFFFLALIFWIFIWATGELKGRSIRIGFVVIIVAGILSSTTYHTYKYYLEKRFTHSEQEAQLWNYRPFYKKTKAVSLDETSTLRFSTDLPLIDGATALYPLYAAFVKATFPHPKDMSFPNDYQNEDDFYNINFGHVRGSTTPNAYRSLISGKADVIFCAKPSDEQLAAIKDTGKELQMTPIGHEAFVFFVNTGNPVNGLAQEQIRDIYSGRISNWKQIGGRDKCIRAFQRPSGSGSQTMFLHIMGETRPRSAPQEDIVSGMGGIIKQTARYRNHNNAIGYSFLFFTTEMIANKQIKLLDIDGIAPNKTTIADGTYPFTGAFYAITLGEPKPNVKKLIEWILSEQGQELVEKTGYVAIII